MKPCALDRLLSKRDVTKPGNGKMKNGDKKRIGNEDTDRAWVQGRFYSPFFIFPFPYKGVSIQFFRCIPIFFNRLKSIFFPCPIAIKFSAIIDYGVKFVKM